MTQVHPNSSIKDMTYNPPLLPDYLSRNHNLTVIVGVPTNEEVKIIHDTIRAVNSVSNFPALYDHKLSTQLAQYLFTVQMAVYRNEYPSSIFPVEHTYTPPPVPSHIPILLEPVVGAPSDEELESAHGVVRAMENLANSPFSDSALSAKLSQHLFNIQFARYIQDSNQGQFIQRSANPLPPNNQNDPLAVKPVQDPNIADQQGPQDAGPTELEFNAPTFSLEAPRIRRVSGPTTDKNSDKLDIAQQLEDANQLLRVIGRTLIMTYSHSAKRWNGSTYSSYRLLNDKCELPWMHRLPEIYTSDSTNLWGTFTVQDLASYLKFYDIGADLIEESTGNLKSDKEADVKKLLARAPRSHVGANVRVTIPTTITPIDILDMTQVHSNSSIKDMTYSPPPLPDYLSRNYDLRVIVGVPTDEEIKAIHDVIRAINSVSTVPSLYDHKLSTQLAQYLFTVQMAVYRNEYPCSVFPGENTYTPPSIPSHIPIALEPVVGSPSDNQLESAHGAVRTLEGLAHSPFFDATLGVKLSQHLFNIQFARYIQDSGQGQFAQKPSNAPLPSQENTNAPIPNLPRDAPDHQQEPQDTGPTNSGSNTPPSVREMSPNPNTLEPTITLQSNDKLDQLYQAQQETNRISRENEELLRGIKQTLITTYIKGRRQSYSSYSAYDTVNHKGESPRMYHLPEIYARDDSTLDRSITDEQVARYLRFYNIGTKLIREETGKLEPGKEADAKRLLGHYVYYYRLPPDENA